MLGYGGLSEQCFRELFVQREHLDASGRPSKAVSSHALALGFILATVTGPSLLRLPRASVSRCRLTYFTTMRADESVSAVSQTDGLAYFNVRFEVLLLCHISNYLQSNSCGVSLPSL